MIGTILLGLDLILKPPLPGNGTQPVVLSLKLGPGTFYVLGSLPQHRRGNQIGCQRFLHLCDADLHVILVAPQGVPGLVLGSGLKATSVVGHVVGEELL